MAQWEPDLEAVEAIIGYEFVDRSLLAIALDTSRMGFGALESLGDSINDLATTAYVLSAGLPRPEASRLTANDHLQAMARTTVGPYARIPATGDTIESIVGAVHLDGGYESAALVGLQLCSPGAAPGALDGARLEPRDVRWLGRQAIDAFFTERAIRSKAPAWPSQLDLHHARNSHPRARVATTSPDSSVAEVAAETIGDAFVTGGWDAGLAEFANAFATRD